MNSLSCPIVLTSAWPYAERMKDQARKARVYDFAAYRERRVSGADEVVEMVLRTLRQVDDARHREEDKALQTLDFIRRIERNPEDPPQQL